MLDLVVGIFTLANSFIALFIVIYAVLFLKKTKSHKERRPWDYLVFASLIYLAYTILLMLLEIYQFNMLGNLNMYELSIFFQFIYTGLILLSFISQTDLIFKNDIIIIMKKDPEIKSRLAETTPLVDEVSKKDAEKIVQEIEKVEQAKTAAEAVEKAAVAVVPAKKALKKKAKAKKAKKPAKKKK